MTSRYLLKCATPVGWAMLLLAAATLSGCKEPANGSRDFHGFLRLHRLVDANNIEGVQALFKEGANANVLDLDGVAPLHRAARDGNVEMARLLLDHYADPKIVTRDGWDALHLAAWNRHTEMVQLLLSYGANAAHKTPQGWTVIHIAAIKGDPLTLDNAMRDWPCYQKTGKPAIDDKDDRELSPLLLALKHDHPAVVELLLAKGADPNVVDKSGNTPLHLLVGKGSKDLALQFLVHKAELNRPNGDRLTPYALAVEKKDAILAKVYFDNGGR